MRRNSLIVVLTLAALFAVHATNSIAAWNATGDSVEFYTKHVKNTLQSRCYACHGALKQEAGLRLDTVALILQGGDSGSAIDKKQASESELLKRVASKDLSVRMPPEGEALKDEEIEAIRNWLQSGAEGPADEKAETDPNQHWSFKLPQATHPGLAKNPRWNQNSIDRFIATKHDELGLVAVEPASKGTWLRRVYLDLTGLPPSLEELRAFEADNSDEAFEQCVDRLLASPQYGERWGRHWMDIWRYSDWWGLGAEVRNSQKHIWHWRDWIIESLNNDQAYDQMLREMLAADELYPNDLNKLRATGYLARQYFKFNRTTWLDETIEHTSKGMLGLTFNCMKCHDHKYDPVTQVEYYQLRAFFEPYQVRTDFVAGENDIEKDGIPRAFDCNLDARTYLHRRGDDRNPDPDRIIEPKFPKLLDDPSIGIEQRKLPVESYQPGLRTHVIATYRDLAQKKRTEAIADLRTAELELESHTKQSSSSKPEQDSAKPVVAKELLVLDIQDDFANRKPDLWDEIDGQWKFAEGGLHQTSVSTNRAVLRWKKEVPADFEATLVYTPIAGDMWKSIGIVFDALDANGGQPSREVLAYSSSYAGGPKAQVAYKFNGEYTYPPSSAVAQPIDLLQKHTIELKVRENLVNMKVDGGATIAYRLPIDRHAGRLELIAFDGSAIFHSFRLRSLDAKVEMQEDPQGVVATSISPLERSKLAHRIAEGKVKVAEREWESLNARHEADLAKHSLELNGKEIAPDAIKQLSQKAVSLEQAANLARTELSVAQSELELAESSKEKREESAKKSATAKEALAKATSDGATPSDQYPAILGALKTLENNLETEDSRRKPFPTESTGRRTAFASWVASAKNPLTARVAVNHVWARHFGRGLVATVFDFGRKGASPTHQELLDTLAADFVESGWSMKRLHRQIVLSQTYRLSSSSLGCQPKNLELDPDNKFYWRANPIRMEAQVIRDSLLAMSGELDLTLGGPTIGIQDEMSKRRSLYYFHSHNEHEKFLSLFDDARVSECYRRAESIVPQQALALENSPLAMRSAAKIASRLNAAYPDADDRTWVQMAFLVVLGFEPSDKEHELVAAALNEWKGLQSEVQGIEPRQLLIHSLINHNDFVTIR